MSIKFLKDVKVGRLSFNKNSIVKETDRVIIEDLNDKLIMLIIDDIRYDVEKEYIEILK